MHHKLIFPYLVLLLAQALSFPALAAAEKKYVVNLLSMKQEIVLDKVRNISSIKGRHTIVIYNKPLNAGSTNVLCVGYFSSYNEARKVAGSLGKYFKGAYASEFKDSFTELKTINLSTVKPKIVEPKAKAVAVRPKQQPKPKKNPKNASTLSEERLEQIMLSARKAIKAGDNRKAIQLFSAVLSAPENDYSIEALELLGLARERNHQYNHAVNIYNKYIKTYPDSKGIGRVRQRLVVLTTASKRVDKTRASENRKTKTIDRPWRTYGTLSQSYRDNNGDNSDVYTFVSVNSRKAGEDTDIGLEFSGSRTSQIKGDDDDDFQISELNADLEFINSGIETQIGRMRTRSGGIYGRLDGLIVSYDDLDTARYTFMYGLPVSHSRELMFDSDNEKQVYALNTELMFLDKTLALNAYLVEQRNDGLLDRQAIGTELRYYKSDLAMFSLVDYDISYDRMGIFLWSGNWKTSNELTLFFNADYRSSPLITTGNAVIGQTETDLGTLAAALGEDAVRQLAEDRTSTTKLLSMGASWPLSSETTLRTDLTATTISSTPDSGGVVGTAEVGPDYYYSLQYVMSSFFKQGDTTIWQLQYADLDTSKKLSLLASTRLPLTEKFKLTPRAVVSYQDVELGENRAELRTSIRADYTYSKNLYLDAELAADFSNIDDADSNDTVDNYYFIATYRWLF